MVCFCFIAYVYYQVYHVTLSFLLLDNESISFYNEFISVGMFPNYIYTVYSYKI